MHPVDWVIVGIYIPCIVLVGLWAKKKAGSGIDGYFLGKSSHEEEHTSLVEEGEEENDSDDGSLPWWALAASGMASNLDISGTMINTAFVFVLGLKGLYVEIRGGATMILAWCIAFMGKWNRRSQVMTMSEWMEFRFGKGKQGNVARISTAILMILFNAIQITYFAIGSGKFMSELIGVPDIGIISGEVTIAVAICLLATIYTITSGLAGVVYTDVFQSIIIFGAIVFVCGKVMLGENLPLAFNVSVPAERDGEYISIPMTREKWKYPLASSTLDLPSSSTWSSYNMFAASIAGFSLKAALEGFGGPSSYMAQRFFATSTDRNASIMSALWLVLLSLRWAFIAGIAWLGIQYSTENPAHAIEDPERVVPIVVERMLPAGLEGLCVAGFLSAAMSTFDSTLNAAASYYVKDLYHAYIRPDADDRSLLLHSRVSSILIVIVGLLMMFFVHSINEVWSWINMGLAGSFYVPLLLRWYWDRLNGYGYAAGLFTGLVLAFLVKGVVPQWPEYVTLPVCAGGSLVVCVMVTLLTPPTDPHVVQEFYTQTRPLGWWKDARTHVAHAVRAAIDMENKRDMVTLFLAIGFQLSLFMMWMTLVVRAYGAFGIIVGIVVILCIGLYFVWYLHLDDKIHMEAMDDGEEVEEIQHGI